MPNSKPDVLSVRVKFTAGDEPVVVSIKVGGKEQLINEHEDTANLAWRISRGFTREKFEAALLEMWHIPAGHLEVTYVPDLPADTRAQFPDDKTLGPLNR